jgi:hypothetical protein
MRDNSNHLYLVSLVLRAFGFSYFRFIGTPYKPYSCEIALKQDKRAVAESGADLYLIHEASVGPPAHVEVMITHGFTLMSAESNNRSAVPT